MASRVFMSQAGLVYTAANPNNANDMEHVNPSAELVTAAPAPPGSPAATVHGNAQSLRKAHNGNQ